MHSHRKGYVALSGTRTGAHASPIWHPTVAIGAPSSPSLSPVDSPVPPPPPPPLPLLQTREIMPPTGLNPSAKASNPWSGQSAGACGHRAASATAFRAQGDEQRPTAGPRCRKQGSRQLREPGLLPPPGAFTTADVLPRAPSLRSIHPSSVLFSCARDLKQFVLPMHRAAAAGASDGSGRGRPPVAAPRNGGSSSAADHGKQALEDMSELMTSLRVRDAVPP